MSEEPSSIFPPSPPVIQPLAAGQIIRIKRSPTTPAPAVALTFGELALTATAGNLVPTLWAGDSTNVARVVAGPGNYVGDIVINRSAGAVSPVEAGTIAPLHVVGDGTNFTAIEIDSYAGAAFFRFRMAAGTLAAPTAILQGGNMGGMSSRGWTSAGAWAATDNIRVTFLCDTAGAANTPMSTTDTGTAMRFDITAQATTATISVLGLRTMPGATGQATVNMGDLSAFMATPGIPPFGSPPGINARILGYPSTSARLAIDSFAPPATPASQILIRRANGTQAAPTAVALGDQLGAVQWFGATAASQTAPMGEGAAINVNALEAFTATANGAEMQFLTTAATGTTPGPPILRMGIRGGLIMYPASGTPPNGGAAGDMGPGSINAMSLWIGGVAVGTSTGMVSVVADGTSIVPATGGGIAGTPISVGTVDGGTF
jgi:hypothetical protein